MPTLLSANHYQGWATDLMPAAGSLCFSGHPLDSEPAAGIKPGARLSCLWWANCWEDCRCIQLARTPTSAHVCTSFVPSHTQQQTQVTTTSLRLHTPLLLPHLPLPLAVTVVTPQQPPSRQPMWQVLVGALETSCRWACLWVFARCES